MASLQEPAIPLDDLDAALEKLISREAANLDPTKCQPFTESEISRISDILIDVEKGLQVSGWAKRPRTYIVLRMTGCTHLMEVFVRSGLFDISFPYSKETLPQEVRDESIRDRILKLQHLVYSKSGDFENSGPHRHVENGELYFKHIRELGKGGIGQVDEIWSKGSNKKFARKRIFRRRNFKMDQKALKDYEGELAVMKKLSHEHLVKLVGSYTDRKFVALIMEPVAECNLKAFLLETQGESPTGSKPCKVRSYYGCLVTGLLYLHENKVRHKDIKPENILIKDGVVLLADFGTALDWSDQSNSKTAEKPKEYTARYCSPEVAEYEPRGTSSDIWSLGCVFLEMSTILHGSSIDKMNTFFEEHGTGRSYIRLNLTATDLWIKTLREKDCLACDKSFLDSIPEMIEENPNRRPSAREVRDKVLEHNMNAPYPFCGTCCSDDMAGDSADSICSSKGDFSRLAFPNEPTYSQDFQQQQPQLSAIATDITVLPSILPARYGSPTRNDQESVTRLENKEDQGTIKRLAKEHGKAQEEAQSDTLESMLNAALEYQRLGRFQEAAELYEKMVEARKRTLGDEHADTLTSMHDLAYVYGKLDRFREAAELYEKVVEARKRTLGDEHADTLTSMHKQGYNYIKLVRFHEAAELYEKVVEARKRTLGDEHADTLTSMHNQGYNYIKLDRFQEAAELYEKMVEARKRTLGDEHADTLRSMHNQGYNYIKLDRFQEAAELYEKMVEAGKRTLGDEHADTLRSMHKLAYVYDELDRFREAAELYEKVVEAWKRTLGDEHADTLTSMHDLAYVYGKLDRFREAAELYEKVVEARKRTLGDEHADTLTSMHNLANVYGKLHRFREAAELYEKVVEARKRTLGDEHADTLTSMHDLAYVYGELDRFREAAELYEKVVEARKRTLGDEHADTLTSMHKQGYNYIKLVRFHEAAELYEKVVEARKRTLGDEHADTLTSMHNQGYNYIKLDRFHEAAELYEKVVEARKRTLGDEHADTLTSMHDLAYVYGELHRFREAAELYEKVVGAWKRTLGDEHANTLTSMRRLSEARRKESKQARTRKKGSIFGILSRNK